ncbi:MAG TPA: NUDIX hydrolase [Sphingomicrobium sp.]
MRQVAAFPYRVASGFVEVLLVTSSSNRWIIPKGDVDGGMAPHLAAEKEAFEEGGVRGRIGKQSIGSFATCKEQDGALIPLNVEVFPLEVDEELDGWPEMETRKRRWLRLNQAAGVVEDQGLAAIIDSFR